MLACSLASPGNDAGSLEGFQGRVLNGDGNWRNKCRTPLRYDAEVFIGCTVVAATVDGEIADRDVIDQRVAIEHADADQILVRGIRIDDVFDNGRRP